MWRFIGRLLQKRDKNFVEIPTDAKGKLYVSPMPFGPYDCFHSVMRSYILHKVQHAFILVTDDEIHRKAKRDIKDEYRKHDINPIHFPIPDLTCPFLDDLADELNSLVQFLNDGENLAIHCNAGVGRTCLVAGCILCAINRVTPDQALDHVREYTNVNITTQQKNLIRKFSETLRVVA